MAGWRSFQSAVGIAACVLLGLLEGAAAGEWCGRYYEYCEYGCCGDYDHYCCGLDVALIVGCVVGGVLCVAVIITVVCCILKKQGYSGRVVGPHAVPAAGAGNVMVVHSANPPMGYPNGPPVTGVPPPAVYQGHPLNQPPPPYAFSSNPAYPPPPPPPGLVGRQGGGGGGGGFAAPAAPGYTSSATVP